MPFDLTWYAPEWNRLRKERIAAANKRCEACDVADRSVRDNADGEPYMVYLSIAHRDQYQTWRHDAETMVLCQRCHRRYDRQFRRKAGARDLHPIGAASLYVDYQGRRILAGVTRTVEHLRAMIDALPSGSRIEVQIEALTAVVGNAHYRKPDVYDTEGGGAVPLLTILAEHGACQGLATLLHIVP